MGNATQARSGDPRPGGLSADSVAPATTAAVTAAEVRDPGAEHMRNAGPGWYYDPDDEAIYRYWDGHDWTDHRSDTVLSEIPT